MTLRAFLARVSETSRLMVGVPPYHAYRAHMAEHHPEEAPLDEVEFFRNRQEARYGGRNGGRCC